MKHYSPTDYVNWLEEYKVRQKAGLEARKIVASFSKRFFSEHVSACYVAQAVCVCVRVRVYTHVYTRVSCSTLTASSLFDAHTIPCLNGCKSHCVLFPPVQQHGAICPCQPYFSKARDSGL